MLWAIYEVTIKSIIISYPQTFKLKTCFSSHVKKCVSWKFKTKVWPEAFTLLNCYTARIGSWLPTFRYRITVPSPWNNWCLKMGPITCAKTPITSCKHMPHNTSGEQRLRLHCGGSLKSCKIMVRLKA